MKKMIKTVLSAALVLSVASSFVGCGQSSQETQSTLPSQSTQITTIATNPTDSPSTGTTVVQEPTDMIEDSLFIGDSRTVGLLEYSGVDADFFASVGMSVYNIHDNAISVPNVGKLTLTELLSNKSYGKIYLMVGINELGYDLDQTISEYSDLVDSVCQMQPNAKLFIQANLHVTEEKSNAHSYITNAAIDAFNSKISKLADGKNVFYLDVNPEFDNANGALSEEYTSDGVHLYAKYYMQWGEWIEAQSAQLIKEG